MARRANRLLLFLVLLGTSSACPVDSASAPPSRHLIDTVPYIRQLPDYCGPASLSSLLAHWKLRVDQRTIARTAFDSRSSDTNGADLLFYCRDSGLAAYSFNGTLRGLKEMIARGFPILILQEMSRKRPEGHFRVAVGYNDEAQTITLRDGWDAGYVVLSYTEFDSLWSKRGRWALVAMPRDKDAFAGTLGLRNAVLHMDLAQAYLRRGDRTSAEAECLEALKIEPGNRYARDLLARARREGK